MEKWIYILERWQKILWGMPMLVLLLVSGALLMVKTRFFLFRKSDLIVRKTIGSLGAKKQQGITSFQAVTTALAGTLGVGSIVGVATAITMGGAGALFWMCVSALFGMMCKYGEVVLAMHYRHKENGVSYGGAMYVLEKGCRMPVLGVLFALFCILASFGIGNITPTNTIVESVRVYLPLPPLFITALLAVLVASLIFGKGNRIMRLNEKLIPFVSVLYIAACGYLLFLHREHLFSAVLFVLQDAFAIDALEGGIGGFVISKAIHFGVSRGVFSNEAGMGSSPLSHAGVVDANPVEQGFWGIFEVFFDTLVICLITGMMILTSDAYGLGLEGAALVIACFQEGFGVWGGILFACAIVSFALPSILGWYYYARECIHYLFTTKLMLHLYQACFLGVLVCCGSFDFVYVWYLADVLNALMAIPNLISLFLLNKDVVKLTKEYLILYGR